MKQLKTTKDFKDVVINDRKLIDVRAPIEYEKGSILNSINLPILSNEERNIIGICYKEQGNEEATKLGYELVAGKLREERINSWVKYFNENPDAMIYCFRGGSRSTIAQRCIYEATGKEIIKLDGGYKAFRNFLIDSVEPINIKSKPLVITGYTGSGKTILLNKFKNSIDLEGIANHRGSTFGHFITNQPTQVNFENTLAYEIIKHNEKGFKFMVLEDEGKSIGKSFIPKCFYNNLRNGDLVFLEVPLEERIQNILKDYVIDGQNQYIRFWEDREEATQKWFEDMVNNMERIKNKLGGDRFKSVIDEFKLAYEIQKNNNSFDYYYYSIKMFLKNYYDPMYKYSIDKGNRNIIYRGNKEEVLEFIEKLEK